MHLSGELGRHILDEVQEFTSGAPLTDDRTLVVLKVK